MLAEFLQRRVQVGLDRIIQRLLLAAEFLRALRVVPEFGLFELALNFGQAMLLGVEVKDTPVRPGTGRADRAAC